MSESIKQLEQTLIAFEHHKYGTPNHHTFEDLDTLEKKIIWTDWRNGLGRVKYLKGEFFRLNGKQQEAFDQFSEITALGSIHQDPFLSALGGFGLSQLAFLKSDLSDAYTQVKEAEANARLSNNIPLLASCQNLEACIKSRYGEHDAAIILLRAALDIAKLHAPELSGMILSNIVDIHHINGEYHEARKYGYEYLDSYSSKDQPQRRVTILINLATIELELNEIRKGELYLKQAEALLSSKNSIDYATLLCCLANISAKKRKYHQALKQFQKAASIYRKFNRPRLESNAICFVSKTLLKQGNIKSSLRYAANALKLAQKAGDRYMTKESLQMLYEAHKEAKDIKLSLKYLEEYNELSRQDAAKQFESRLAFVNLKADYEKKQAEAQEARRHAEVLREELEQKDHELTERTKNLIRQTESISKLRDDLRLIIKSAPTNPIARQISERLKSLPNAQSNWEEFENYFNSVYPRFEEKLVDHYPTLTKMERKLCILLRSNLMSVDIAKLLTLSERNIENHRHRLRKKLGVSAGVNLTEFLTKIG